MLMRRVVREGFIAGLIGASAVAVWFLIIDIALRRAFYTPAVLGSAVFLHITDPTQVQITFPPIIMYTMLHFFAFMLIGFFAALFVAGAEHAPQTFFFVVVLFAIFEFGFIVIVWLVAQPLLSALAWWAVAIGNLIAAIGMGMFLWFNHPKLRERLVSQPLGDPGS